MKVNLTIRALCNRFAKQLITIEFNAKIKILMKILIILMFLKSEKVEKFKKKNNSYKIILENDDLINKKYNNENENKNNTNISIFTTTTTPIPQKTIGNYLINIFLILLKFNYFKY